MILHTRARLKTANEDIEIAIMRFRLRPEMEPLNPEEALIMADRIGARTSYQFILYFPKAGTKRRTLKWLNSSVKI